MSKGFILWNGGWKCRSYPQAQNHAQKVKSINLFYYFKTTSAFFCICDWNFDRRRPLICCYLFQLKYWRVRIEFLMPDCSDGSNTILSNIDRTRTSFFEHRTNSDVFICWWPNSNTLFLALNDRTSNFKHCSTHH